MFQKFINNIERDFESLIESWALCLKDFCEEETRRDSSIDCRPSTVEAQPIGKIHPFSKIAVSCAIWMLFKI